LGVSDAERQQLASLYPAGQSLWRMSIPHFDQPWDANMGTRCKNNKCDYPKTPKPTPKTPLITKPCKTGGSVIECENQVLGESVGITGTSFSLQYQSDRMPGFKSGGLNIPLVRTALPEGLKGINLEVFVAGQKYTQSFLPQANLVASYEWDGKDAYGRPVQGNQTATVRIGYVYELEYVPTPRFGYNGDSTISVAPARQEIALWTTRQARVEHWYPTNAGLGGWSLNAHHLYDPLAQVLYLGTGERRDAQDQLVSVISTVAGGPAPSFSGDGGPASQAYLNQPTGVAFAPDGSFYIADRSNCRVRRVGSDGIITTVAGNGFQCTGTGGNGGDGGDGGQATQASFNALRSIALSPDGSLYIGTDGYRVRRVGPDGIITTVAGTGIHTFSGDGGPATQAFITVLVEGLAIARDGSLYFTSYGTLRRVGPDGIINTVAGVNGTDGFIGDGGPATQAQFFGPLGVAVAPDGRLYVADKYNNRVRRVSPPLPGFSASDIVIASEDGSELYQFNTAGRHLKTLNALTGANLIEFTYDADGRLLKATDGDGNITTFERDATGNPTAIVGPFGQRTTLALDANGYLARITTPANEAVQISYSADGLLQTFTDPNGHTSTMTFDSLGRLQKDQNAAGGSQNLAHTEFGQDYEVTRTTGLNRTTRHRVESLLTGWLRRLDTGPDGTSTEVLSGTDGSTRTTSADGSVSQLLETGDPRFAMQSPIPKTVTLTTGGLTSTATTERSANLATPGNPLSLTSLTDKLTINGRVSTLAYDAASKTFTSTSAAGRTGTSVIDVLGRPTRTQIAGLLPVDSSYDTKGRLASITQGSGTDARTLDFVYNAQGHLDTATDPLGRTVRYAYDAVGRVTRETLPDGREILYSYDASGNLKTLAPPGRPDHGFNYTAVDLPRQYTPPNVTGTGTTL
jgi:YD repeat-containing protein